MSALSLVAGWLALDYAIAALLVYRGARGLGATRAGAGLAALLWPQAMFGVALSDRAIWRSDLRALNA